MTPSLATVKYAVSLAHPEQHVFDVTMTIPDVQGQVDVRIPAWDALYQVRDFTTHVREVSAFVGDTRVPVVKMDKQTWRILAQETVTVKYSTFWDEAGPFATQLNSEHAFINWAMILMYIEDRRREKVSIDYLDLPEGWRVGSPAWGAELALRLAGGTIHAKEYENYDRMVDAPVEIGKFETFVIPGISPPVSVIVHGNEWKKGSLERDLKRICEYELKLMGGAPYEGYTFIFHVGKGAGGGGMEHSNSTAIGIPSDEYLPGVAAHEFFHLWNVKRIRPASLEPVDYAKEQYTRALWFAEGVTSTYGAFTLVRSGIWSKHQFYADLGEQISELERRPANRWQSAEESSLDAWLEKYDLYNGPDESVSYYAKGQILGDLLDVLIRDRTDSEKSLDDVMRRMNEEFAKQGKFYRDSLDVRLTAEKVAGGSFEEFFQRYVSGAEALPYQQVLGLAGLELKTVEHKRALLGFTAERDASGTVMVKSVDAGSPAALAGLQAGDAILGWNGGDVPRRLQRWIFEQKAGDTLRLRVRREDKEIAVEFRLGELKDVAYEVEEDAHASDKARRIRDGILHGVTQAVAVH